MSGSMTGGVDSSIPLQARAPAPTNPLAQIGEFAQVQNALNQAKLFPTTQQTAQVNLAQRNNQAVYGSMIPLLSEPNLTLDRVTHHLAGLEGSGLATHAPINEIQNLPGAPNSPEWQRALKIMIASRAQIDPGAAVARAVGTPVDQDTGLTINSGVRAPEYLGGGVTFATATPVYPSRAVQMGRVSGPPGPDGAPTTVPAAAVTPSDLSGLNMGTGRIRDTVPAGLRNPNAPAPAGALPGQITTGLGPAATTAQATTGTTAATGFQRISDEGVQARGQDALLANMQNDLDRFTTGTGASRTLDIQRLFQSFGPRMSDAFNAKIAAQESFDKLANQLADAQGAGSDARLHVNQGANPSSGLSPEGADFILRQLRGNTDYKHARQILAAQYPNKTDLQGFEASQGTALDPRAFQFNRLSPEQKGNYLAGIKDARERDAFKKNYLDIQKAGLLALPDGG